MDFIQSGCVVLDKVLGGGWALGRVVNVIGDQATGKTLLAEEACANFVGGFPKGEVYYHEAEAAFDFEHASSLGIPIEKITFIDDIFTVDGLFESVKSVAKANDKPKLYIVDSLDALSATEDSKKDINEPGYAGPRKAQKMSEMFRKLISEISDSKMCLMIISQVRDNIGVQFGQKKTRSGGRALDFYSSQILWLADLGGETKQIKGMKKVIGRKIRAKCSKNKVGLPHRECNFSILFGYGINDIKASAEWLQKVDGGVDDLDLPVKKSQGRIVLDIDALFESSLDPRSKITGIIKRRVNKLWEEIEKEFLPKRGKYK